jgi:HD-like signal output (HDOD) protein
MKINMEPMSREFSGELMHAIDRMPAFPVSVQNILRLSCEVSCAPRELVEAIEKDPIITIKVLRVVNSAQFSLPRQIFSLEHAVVLLGFNTIKNLARNLAATRLVPDVAHSAFDAKKFTCHSLVTAEIAHLLGQRFPAHEAHDFFIAGLLHDFGKVVLAQTMPAQFQKALEYSLWHEVSMHQGLLQVCALDHAQIGAMLLQHWRFPTVLVDGIRLQHAPGDCGSTMALCVQVANCISKQLGVDFAGGGQPEALNAATEQCLGATLQDTMATLGDLAAIVHEARQFADL